MGSVKKVAFWSQLLIFLSCVIVLFMPHFLHINFSWDSSVFTVKDFIPDHGSISFSLIPLSILCSPALTGKLFFCIFSQVLFVFCFFFSRPDMMQKRYLGAVCTIIIITLLLSGLLACFLAPYDEHFHWNTRFFRMMFLAFPALTITPLFGLKPAVCSGLLTSVLSALLLDDPLNAVIIGIILSCVGCIFIQCYKMENYRRYILYNTSVLFLTITLLLSCLKIIYENRWTGSCLMPSFDIFVSIALIGSFAPVLTAVILLPAIEWLFRVETNMTYSELCNASNPILSRLSNEAPGTWAHSQDVANVAEKAALAIHANHLKVKACALYHDVGKLENPGMFTENSILADGWTPINDMDPGRAVSIIRSHVVKGKALIPYQYRSIKDSIASHHGTMFIGAFYKKAQMLYGDGVDEKFYHYPGPLPANREELILMLSDSVCAAVQSLREKTPENIENMVSSIFLRQIETRQYDRADITVHELLTVYSTILQFMLVKNKNRIDYKKVSGGAAQQNG